MKQAVDEIREYGKFVFWRYPDRLKGYTSDYWQRKNASKPVATPKANAKIVKPPETLAKFTGALFLGLVAI